MKIIGFIGAGNMAEAIARSLKGSVELCAYDISEERREVFSDFGVRVFTDLSELVRLSEIIVLAVKPQVMDAVLEQLSAVERAQKLFVSIAAGVTVARISALLGSSTPVVRVMPNTPIMQGRGAVGVYGGPSATSEHVSQVKDLFTPSSQVVIVDDEAQMDTVTAVSGSGPAYFFYMVEAMIAAGVQDGLSEEEAKLLAASTCLGAGAMLLDSPKTAAQLRALVTSPNGTTQAAIESLEAAGVKESIQQAVIAAADRSRELRAS